MPTGDGLLARLMPAASIPLGAMAGLCEAARRCGNGTLEITARGSLQVRGLSPQSAPLFAAAVADLGIDAQHGVPVIAGIDDGAADFLARELRRTIADAELALSPKVSTVVDGDGPLHLDGLSADVRLRVAVPAQGSPSSAPRFHLGLGGDGSTTLLLPLPPKRERERATARGDAPATVWLGTVTSKDAAHAVVGILSTVAARGPAARAADVLAHGGVAPFQAFAAIERTPAPPPRILADMIGLHAMRDGALALGVGLPFGHTHAEALAELVRTAVRHRARAVRLVPGRAMLLTGVSALHARDLIVAAERLGFVVHVGDPRRRIAACPGAPACASGLIPARTLASMLAPTLAPVLAPAHDGVVVHISGCPKGCAHPGPAALTLVGTPQGCGVVHHGTARETPDRHVAPARLGDEISCLATGSLIAGSLAARPPGATHG
jgi:precorrin-3B synthase